MIALKNRINPEATLTKTNEFALGNPQLPSKLLISASTNSLPHKKVLPWGLGILARASREDEPGTVAVEYHIDLNIFHKFIASLGIVEQFSLRSHGLTVAGPGGNNNFWSFFVTDTDETDIMLPWAIFAENDSGRVKMATIYIIDETTFLLLRSWWKDENNYNTAMNLTQNILEHTDSKEELIEEVAEENIESETPLPDLVVKPEINEFTASA